MQNKVFTFYFITFGNDRLPFFIGLVFETGKEIIDTLIIVIFWRKIFFNAFSDC